MAFSDSKELVNIVGDDHTDKAMIDTDRVMAGHPIQSPIRRSGSDPTVSRRVISTESDDHTSYQFDPVYDVATTEESRATQNDTNSNSGRATPRTRSTRNLAPLYVRAVRNPRYAREISTYYAMTGENGPFTTSPDRFLASQGSPYMSHLMDAVQSTDDGLQHKNIKLSRRLPGWMWYLLAKSLGIKLTPRDKPWFATLLHTLTLTVAVLFGTSGAWFTIYDIKSEYSKTTVLIGTVTMMIGFGWMLLGVYAHKLAGKLFSNKNFAESVRMHSKTFLKISTAGLMSILGLGLVAANSYSGSDKYLATTCSRIQLLPIVCHLFYVSKTVYTFVCVIWTLLVGFVLLSVCRTHTIGIRRFMREMILDAKNYEAYWLDSLLGNIAMDDPDSKIEDEWFIWDDHVMSGDYDNPAVTSQSVFLESIRGTTYIPPRHLQDRIHRISTRSEPISEQEEYTNAAGGNSGTETIRESENECDVENPPEEEATATKLVLSPPIMSNDDLLFTYWKLSRRLVMTSRFLQRWLSSWISFIFCWCAYYIIFWANHNATITGILQFVCPLLLLLIICSAYAEVNAEGQRLLKCIVPTEKRLRVISFLNQQPLQMQVFSFPITYNAVLGVILAFSVAFASRIVLDEVL